MTTMNSRVPTELDVEVVVFFDVDAVAMRAARIAWVVGMVAGRLRLVPSFRP
jgi:hypothetical protein